MLTNLQLEHGQDAYERKLAEKEAEITRLNSKIKRRDAKIAELEHVIHQVLDAVERGDAVSDINNHKRDRDNDEADETRHSRKHAKSSQGNMHFHF
jgi:multidrug resistance efflux pump